MKKSIFEFSSYKPYLRELIRSTPQFGHGFRSKIAKALSCQTAYISQVLNKDANFSLEQAEELNPLLHHTKEESRFFLLLVQKERAGSVRLREHFENEMAEVLSRREVLKERVEKTDSLSLEKQMRYYSRWYYAAVHVACTIPQLRTKESLAEALQLPSSTVGEVLEFLVEAGILSFANGDYTPGVTRLFLGAESPMINQMHTNWRVRTIQALEKDYKEDLHFSTCISLSKKDFRVVKDLLIEAINKSRAIVRESAEEKLCVLSVDLFSLLKTE